MGIWKWMKYSDYSLTVNRLSGRCPRLPVLVLVCVLSAASLSAAPSLGFRVLPAYYIPLGDPIMQGSFGVAGALDVMPTNSFGLFAQGEYIRVGLKNVDPVQLFDGSAGVQYLWRLSDRWSLRSEVMGGVYQIARKDPATLDTIKQSGISAGARVSGNYHISPALSASLVAGVRYFAYTPEPFMKALSIGAGLNVNLTELFTKKARVAVEKISEAPVFPVSYAWYDDNSFATLKLTNNELNTITDVEVSFYLEQYMGQPKRCMTFAAIKPGESVEIPVKAFFSESMLELTERIQTEAKILTTYRSLGSKRQSEQPLEIPVYHRNAMSWDDDRRAASFVSSKDPAALWFSKYVSSIVRERFRPGVNENIQYAMGISESLNAYGLNYVIDPSSAYADNAGSTTSVDFLQYPYQTLMYRGGDCDDLSILYCSLLEAIGIDSAFVTIPGHIFIAFSAGMTEEEARANFYAPDQLIYRDGQAWVPLEITLTREGFNKAWKIGAKEWNDANGRGTANLYPMKESWKVYKPVSIPGAASRFTLPEEEKTALAFDASLNLYVEREIRPQIRSYQAMLAKNDTAETRNRLGVLYGRYGMLQEAQNQFSIAAKRGYSLAWTNLGNIAFMRQEYDGALDYYNYSLSLEPSNTVALLGAARCYYEMEEFTNSDALYAELGTRDAVLGRQYGYLGSFFESQGRAYSLSDRLSTTTWALPMDEIYLDKLNSRPMVRQSESEVIIEETPEATEGSGNREGDPSGSNADFPALAEDPFLAPKDEDEGDIRDEETPGRLDVPTSGGLTAMLTIANDDLPPPKPTVDLKPKFKRPPVIPATLVETPPVTLKTPSVAVAAKPAPTLEPVAVIAEKPAPVLEPVAVAVKPAPIVEPVAIAEEPAPTVEPVAVADNTASIVEPVAVAETVASVDEPVPEFTQIEPKEITKAASASEKPAKAEIVPASLTIDPVAAETPVAHNGRPPLALIAAVLAGLIAAASALAIRIRIKRNSLKGRNKP